MKSDNQRQPLSNKYLIIVGDAPSGMKVMDLLKKGVKNPKRVPPYVIGRIFSQFGPDWQRKNGVITWTDNWGWGNESPPGISATDYYHYCKLEELFQTRDVENALEVGCGYGRVLPWIAKSTGANVCGIDANPDAIATAREHYPNIRFETQNATDLSYDDSSFDLVVTWTVLQHIPPKQIDEVSDELERVLEPDGLLLLLEDTKGDSEGPSVWSRSIDKYDRMLPNCKLIENYEYDLPHIESEEITEQILLFRTESE